MHFKVTGKTDGLNRVEYEEGPQELIDDAALAKLQKEHTELSVNEWQAKFNPTDDAASPMTPGRAVDKLVRTLTADNESLRSEILVLENRVGKLEPLAARVETLEAAVKELIEKSKPAKPA